MCFAAAIHLCLQLNTVFDVTANAYAYTESQTYASSKAPHEK